MVTLDQHGVHGSDLRSGGIAWNNGAPGSERIASIENDFGVMIASDEFSSSDFQGLQSVTMQELGHALGAGWADDDTSEPVGCGGPNGDEWSVMSQGWNDPLDNQPMNGRYIAFSIEELSTVEFNRIDSRDA